MMIKQNNLNAFKIVRVGCCHLVLFTLGLHDSVASKTCSDSSNKHFKWFLFYFTQIQVLLHL